MAITKHGHHISGTTEEPEHKDVDRARCGGPTVCLDCALDAARVNQFPKSNRLVNAFGDACDIARGYGRRVREMEDQNKFEDRKKLRYEWRKFCDSLDKKWRLGVVDAYYDEYCREPIEY